MFVREEGNVVKTAVGRGEELGRDVETVNA
jgi:hypothetical protein